jgi:three-Cys-motif partner protein
MAKEKFNPIIEVQDDGLFIPEVRSWSLEKYRLVGCYCDIFTNGMKNIWDQLVYIDLFAGAGNSKIIESKKVYLSSALIAMSIPKPFTKYILCEKDQQRYEALRSRVDRDFKHLNVDVICGDSNYAPDAILSRIPKFGKGNTLLPFCFIDPYSLNLNFATIEKLATKKLMDFLILQALHMDANRNFEKYIKEENDHIAHYLGMNNWREEFEKDGANNRKDFVKFLAEQYQVNMRKLGYLDNKVMHQIHSNKKNLPLYYLSFYSKHQKGIDFFTKIEKYCTPQLKMDL